jgi:hypothetical protein
MPKQLTGCDYSWDRPDLNCLWGKGVRFLVRYGSRDSSKNLSKPELNSALSIGMSVAVVWQEGKTQMLRGYSGGQTDARDAVELFDSLGLPGIPIHFSCDQDYEACSSSDKTKINDYNNGAKSIIGKARMGGYGDDTYCKAQFDAGRITYGWQTYAWSEGGWEPRCQLRQVNNNVTVCGGKIDWDESWASDFGQWPRPSSGTGGGTGEGDMSASSVIFDGQLHLACVWSDGRVNYAGPDGKWYAVDPKSSNKAKSGAHITVNNNSGLLIITYTNTAGKVCTWQKQADEGKDKWSWYDRKGDAR